MCPLAGAEGGEKEGSNASGYTGPFTISQVQAMSGLIGLGMLMYYLGRPEETLEVGRMRRSSSSLESVDDAP